MTTENGGTPSPTLRNTSNPEAGGGRVYCHYPGYPINFTWNEEGKDRVAFDIYTCDMLVLSG